MRKSKGRKKGSAGPLPSKGLSPAPREQLALELGSTAMMWSDQSAPIVPTGRGLASRSTSSLSPAQPSAVYDAYWRFAAERQRIFFRRVAGQPGPWTSDPILQAYKFTNAYRASDRVSQYLIRSVIYRKDLPRTAVEVCFRILLFKLFNKIETWELLQSKLGAIRFSEYRFETYDKIFTAALQAGIRIYSAAYIMPPGTTTFGSKRKHRNHLHLLEHMLQSTLLRDLGRARNMQRGFELLRKFPTIGDFLAYQFVTDINYSEITDFSETAFVVPGPGARDGLRKCFEDFGGLNEPELIRLMADRQEAEFERLGIKFLSLWGRRLQLIDCQNIFCEIGKYARVAFPRVAGRSGRTRIKQKFSPTFTPIDCWYPPKWGLNARIHASRTPGQQAFG